MAGAVPFPLFVFGSVGVMLSPEVYRKIGEADSISFLSIEVGFFNLPN